MKLIDNDGIFAGRSFNNDEMFVGAILESLKREQGFFGTIWKRILDVYYWFYRPIDKIRHRVRGFFFPTNVVKINSLSQCDYHDISDKLLHVMFTLLCDYYENEAPIIEWSSDENHQQTYFTMNELYIWWTEKRPNRMDPWENVPSIRRNIVKREDGLFEINTDNETSENLAAYDKAVDEAIKKEKECSEEDIAMMKKLCDIHLALWS
jgi:hypothetical protein